MSQTLSELGTRLVIDVDGIDSGGIFSPDRCLARIRFCYQEIARGMDSRHNERQLRIYIKALDEWLTAGGKLPRAWVGGRQPPV